MKRKSIFSRPDSDKRNSAKKPTLPFSAKDCFLDIILDDKRLLDVLILRLGNDWNEPQSYASIDSLLGFSSSRLYEQRAVSEVWKALQWLLEELEQQV